MTVGEKRTLAVFVVTALLWIFRQQLADFSPFFKPLSDPVIAIAASFALFSLPSGERKGALLDWKDTTSLPWGILLLFGGGLSLAAALAKTGIIDLVGQYFSDKPGGMFWMVFGLTAISLFLTEVMSNVALVTVLVPVVAALGVSWDENLVLMTVPVTLASSCAFMLPMSTPPNAIVFASGYIKIPQMAKAGLWLNILAVLLIMLFYKTLMAWVWG
jgi:sodium-dependent dicarboxylate transporter 2/3/5